MTYFLIIFLRWKQSQHQGHQVSDVAATTISDQGESVTEEMEKHLQKLERCFESNEINFVHLIEVFPQCYSGSYSDPIFMKLVQLINNSTLSTSPGSIVANIMKQYGSSKKCKLNRSWHILVLVLQSSLKLSV